MRLEEKLVCLRKERHMTQLELAEKLDVSRQAISKWEVGSTVPSTENLIRLAQLYSVPVDRLVNDALDLSAPPETSSPEPDPKKQAATPWMKWAAAAACLFILGLWIGKSVLSSQLDHTPEPPIPDSGFSSSMQNDERKEGAILDGIFSTYMPCYHIDTTNKTMTLGRYNYSELMKRQAKLAEEERNQTIGTEELTDQQLRELASRYDPANMTQQEYDRFINELVSKGVLAQRETYDIGTDRVVLRPGHFSQGSFEPSFLIETSSIRTLADANGNAIDWTELLAQRAANNFSPNHVQYNALLKINKILQEMAQARI